ncbi:unnamed protein product [Protopolystoma xenopodis]|uniref:Uncharacterized protein n=1 Tax=Protopolystoma xenopodis TaxID=117903 RepID=A0A448XEJ9_9PLAT|nr:unnamed protein product [Protopolystoma xenopodis]
MANLSNATMQTKLLRMYQVYCLMLGIMTSNMADDFGLVWRHHTCCLPCLPCPSRFDDPTSTSYSNLVHVLVKLFSRYNSGAIPQASLNTYTVASYCYTCKHKALPPWLIFVVQFVYPEQTIDVYLWSPATHRVEFLSFWPSFRISLTVVIIRIPSPEVCPFGKFTVSSSYLLFALPPSFQLVDPTHASYPDLPNGPVDPFLIFMVDRFNSVPGAISQALSSTYNDASPVDGLGHACRY